MKNLRKIRSAELISKSLQQSLNGGNFPVYLCQYEGQACIVPGTNEVGVCNNRGLCNC